MNIQKSVFTIEEMLDYKLWNPSRKKNDKT